jgi:hypothetical protein
MKTFVSDLRWVGGFSSVSSTNKTDRQDITEILFITKAEFISISNYK